MNDDSKNGFKKNYDLHVFNFTVRSRPKEENRHNNFLMGKHKVHFCSLFPTIGITSAASLQQ